MPLLPGFLLALAMGAQGPGSNPTITGTVIDPQGAVIPGVQITARNTDIKRTFTAVTSQAGTFRLPPLAVGHYVIHAKAPGWTLRQPVTAIIEVSSDLNLTVQMEPRHHKPQRE